MRSIPAAMSWDFWNRERRTLPLFALVGGGMVGLLYGAFSQMGATLEPNVARLLHATVFMCFAPAATGCATLLTGAPKERFTLPATAWSLAGWPICNGAVVVAGGYLLLALIVNTAFWANWPLVKPMAVATCIFVVSHAVSWSLSLGEKWHPTISIAVSVVMSVCFYWHFQKATEQQAVPFWHTFHVWEAVSLLALACCGYLLSVGCLSLSRQGRGLSIVDVVRLLERFDFRFSKAGSFASGRESQSWMEWASKGYGVAGGTGLLAVWLCIWFSTGYLGREDVPMAIWAVTCLMCIGSPVMGMFLGHQGERFDIREFVAVRPLTDHELGDLILVNVLKAYVLSWIVWWFMISLALGCAWLSGTAPTQPQEFFPLRVPPETWGQVALYFLAMAAGLLLVSWTLASLGATAILLRDWLVAVLIVTPLAVAISVPLIFRPPIPAVVVWLLQVAVIASLVGGTIFAFAAAYRLRLIGMQRILWSTALCALLVMAASQLLRFAPDSTLSYRVMQLSTCVLPFMSLAATPLAVWWNRHR